MFKPTPHYDNNGGGYGRTSTGGSYGRSQGNTMPVYQYKDEDVDKRKDDDELDTFVDDVISQKIASRTNMGPDKLGNRMGRRDRGSFTGKNLGGLPIMELSSVPTIKSYLTTAPGRISGDLYGWSHPPLPIDSEEGENPIFSLADILDPMERSFVKHQKKNKKCS